MNGDSRRVRGRRRAQTKVDSTSEIASATPGERGVTTQFGDGKGTGVSTDTSSVPIGVRPHRHRAEVPSPASLRHLEDDSASIKAAVEIVPIEEDRSEYATPVFAERQSVSSARVSLVDAAGSGDADAAAGSDTGDSADGDDDTQRVTASLSISLVSDSLVSESLVSGAGEAGAGRGDDSAEEADGSVEEAGAVDEPAGADEAAADAAAADAAVVADETGSAEPVAADVEAAAGEVDSAEVGSAELVADEVPEGSTSTPSEASPAVESDVETTAETGAVSDADGEAEREPEVAPAAEDTEVAEKRRGGLRGRSATRGATSPLIRSADTESADSDEATSSDDAAPTSSDAAAGPDAQDEGNPLDVAAQYATGPAWTPADDAAPVTQRASYQRKGKGIKRDIVADLALDTGADHPDDDETLSETADAPEAGTQSTLPDESATATSPARADGTDAAQGEAEASDLLSLVRRAAADPDAGATDGPGAPTAAQKRAERKRARAEGRSNIKALSAEESARPPGTAEARPRRKHAAVTAPKPEAPHKEPRRARGWRPDSEANIANTLEGIGVTLEGELGSEEVPGTVPDPRPAARASARDISMTMAGSAKGTSREMLLMIMLIVAVLLILVLLVMIASPWIASLTTAGGATAGHLDYTRLIL